MTDFLSTCCNKPVVTAYGNEGTNHFVCTGCDKACDIRSDTREKWVEELAELLYFDDAEEAIINNDSWHLPSDTDIHFSELIDFIRKTREEAKREEVTGDTSDGYHTFNELYEFRMLYNAHLFNNWYKQGVFDVHKSKNHSDGLPCFDGTYFIVVAQLPTGQISNHYKLKYWDLFHVEEREKGAEWDGHTPKDVAKRLLDSLTSKEGEEIV